MHKVGLKLWSTNERYIKAAQDLYKKAVFDFVELHVVSGSRSTLWREADFPFFLHAPHSYSGLNLSIRSLINGNRRAVELVESFRLELDPKYIVFHPGLNGSVDETIHQILTFKNEFGTLFRSALIENKPAIGLKNENCIGASPLEIDRITAETGLGFCFDVGHAICYAAWRNLPGERVIDEFIKLEPRVCHISDGDVRSEKDIHLHLGMGNYGLKRIVRMIPPAVDIVIETDKAHFNDLSDFEKDVSYLRGCVE